MSSKMGFDCVRNDFINFNGVSQITPRLANVETNREDMDVEDN